MSKSKKKKKAQRKRELKKKQNPSPPPVVEQQFEPIHSIEVVEPANMVIAIDDSDTIDSVDETNYTIRFKRLIRRSPESVCAELIGMPELDRRIMLSMLYFRSRGLDEHVWDILKYWKSHGLPQLTDAGKNASQDVITLKPSSPVTAEANP